MTGLTGLCLWQRVAQNVRRLDNGFAFISCLSVCGAGQSSVQPPNSSDRPPLAFPPFPPRFLAACLLAGWAPRFVGRSINGREEHRDNMGLVGFCVVPNQSCWFNPLRVTKQTHNFTLTIRYNQFHHVSLVKFQGSSVKVFNPSEPFDFIQRKPSPEPPAAPRGSIQQQTTSKLFYSL